MVGGLHAPFVANTPQLLCWTAIAPRRKLLGIPLAMCSMQLQTYLRSVTSTNVQILFGTHLPGDGTGRMGHSGKNDPSDILRLKAAQTFPGCIGPPLR